MEQGKKQLCVMGLGYIGLPTALMFAHHGVSVHGVDVNAEVVEKLNQRKVHIVEPGLQEMLIEVLDSGKLTVGTSPQAAEAYIIAVPTPINPDHSANLHFVKSATEMILPYVTSGTLVVLESTVPPKTVEETLLPILSKTGLRIGADILVSHSPERVLPGKVLEELVHNDRIVGGINEESSRRTVDLYKRFVKGTIHVTDATTAEMVKLMENTYRDINIAFANELAIIAEKLGFDVWEAIELANCHPRVNIHKPGPGVGGHCIAVDPWFIYERAREEAKLIHLSRKTNDHMPQHVVNHVLKLVEGVHRPKVSVLGLAFKGNIDDMRESPAVRVVEGLRKHPLQLAIFDPYVTGDFKDKVPTFEEAVKDSDCIVVLTDHRDFRDVNIGGAAASMRRKVIFDTRNIIDRSQWEKHGFVVHEIGNGKQSLMQREAAATKE